MFVKFMEILVSQGDSQPGHLNCRYVLLAPLLEKTLRPNCGSSKGAITSKIKHAIKLKTSPARLAQLLQPSIAFCFSLQPMTVRRHCLQAKTKCY